MTYRYISLAVGRLPRFREIYDAIPLDKDGKEFPPMNEDEEMLTLWTRKVIDYTIKDRMLYCRLEEKA